jgi:predicted DNA repair protein MutK
MAGGSLLTLLDDIASVLDDVALLTKVAAKKTSGVLGDDLALNAEQVSGVRAERELPVVWAVAKGSFRNKLILVPAALLISAFIPWAITPLLMIGGAYLCFEGFEKIAHKFFHSPEEEAAKHAAITQALLNPEQDLVAFEQEKIKGAIRTDFILSAEIIVISLGTVKDALFSVQVSVVAGIALLMTIGVYGLVAGIVKLDDAGLHLVKYTTATVWANIKCTVGRGLLLFAPVLMKALSVIGTAAMFMVGGGILLHGIPPAHHAVEAVVAASNTVPAIGGLAAALMPTLLGALVGVIAGGLVLAAVALGTCLFKRS